MALWTVTAVIRGKNRCKREAGGKGGSKSNIKERVTKWIQCLIPSFRCSAPVLLFISDYIFNITADLWNTHWFSFFRRSTQRTMRRASDLLIYCSPTLPHPLHPDPTSFPHPLQLTLLLFSHLFFSHCTAQTSSTAQGPVISRNTQTEWTTDWTGNALNWKCRFSVLLMFHSSSPSGKVSLWGQIGVSNIVFVFCCFFFTFPYWSTRISIYDIYNLAFV